MQKLHGHAFLNYFHKISFKLITGNILFLTLNMTTQITANVKIHVIIDLYSGDVLLHSDLGFCFGP